MEEQYPKILKDDPTSSKSAKLNVIKKFLAQLPEDSVRRPVLQSAVNYADQAFFRRLLGVSAPKKYIAFNGIVAAAYNQNLRSRDFLNRAQQSIAEMGFWSRSELRANTLPIIQQQRARCANQIEHSSNERAAFGAYCSLLTFGCAMYLFTEQKFWLVFPIMMCLLLKFWKTVPKDMPSEECPSWMGLILYNHPELTRAADIAGRFFGPLRVFEYAADMAGRGASSAFLIAGEKLTKGSDVGQAKKNH